MNLLEALKINDLVRRKGNPSNFKGWFHINTLLSQSTFKVNGGLNLNLTREDILADDWEALDTKAFSNGQKTG